MQIGGINKMKRTISILLLITVLAISLFSCAPTQTDDILDVGYLKGPTGMGMAKLIDDNGGTEGNAKYTFSNYANNSQGALTDLIDGKIDVACVPTNLAANFYNKNGTIVVLAVNCLNSLYVVTDKSTAVSSLSDLNGQTIYTCSTGTPKPVLEYVLEANGINATVSTTFDGKDIPEPKDIGALVVEGKLPIAVMPEPIITSSLLTIQKNGNKDIEYSIDLDLGEAWDAVLGTPVTMGCIVARADYVNTNKALIDRFLDEYEDSIEYVSESTNLDSAANLVVKSGILDAAPAAKKALGNLGDSIDYIDGDDMKAALNAFYNAVGIKAPAAGFYYED